MTSHRNQTSGAIKEAQRESTGRSPRNIPPENVSDSLARLFPGKQARSLVNQAIEFATRIRQARSMSDDPSQHSDPVALIQSYAEYNKHEHHPELKFKIEHLLAAIISPYLRYDVNSSLSPEQQRQSIATFLSELENPSSHGVFRNNELTQEVLDLVKRISLVSEISLPWKIAMRETCCKDAPKKFSDFAHMVGEAASGDPMVLAIRGMQKLLLVQNAITRADETLLHARSADDLPSEFRSLLNEIKSVYLPLVDAFGLKKLSSQFKEVIFRLEEPQRYREVLNDLLEIARRSVPDNLARQIKDWPSAQGIVRNFYIEEVKSVIPLQLREFVKIEARLKTPYSLFQKFEEKKRKGSLDPKDGPDILDIIAARVIVSGVGSQSMSDLEECSLHDSNKGAHDSYDFSFTKQEQQNLGKIVAHFNSTCNADDRLKQHPPSVVHRLLQETDDPRMKYCEALLLAKPEDTFVETYVRGKKSAALNQTNGNSGIRKAKDTGYEAYHTTLTFILGKIYSKSRKGPEPAFSPGQLDANRQKPVPVEIQVMTLTNLLTKNPHNAYQAERTGIPALSRRKISNTVSVRIQEESPDRCTKETILRLRKGATLADALVKRYGVQALRAEIKKRDRLFSHNAPSFSLPGQDDFSSMVSLPVRVGDTFIVSLPRGHMGYQGISTRFAALIEFCTDKSRRTTLIKSQRRFFGNLHRNLDRQMNKAAPQCG